MELRVTLSTLEEMTELARWATEDAGAKANVVHRSGTRDRIRGRLGSAATGQRLAGAGERRDPSRRDRADIRRRYYNERDAIAGDRIIGERSARPAAGDGGDQDGDR